MGNSVVAPVHPQDGRKLVVALFLVAAVVATVLIVGTLRVRRLQREREAVRRIWKLGTAVLFEGEKAYTNPPLTPAEWTQELSRGPFEDITGPSPQAIVFVRFSRFVDWPEPIVDDGDIPELIEVLRLLPTVTSVILDKNITPAGKARLEKALPGVHFSPPLTIP